MDLEVCFRLFVTGDWKEFLRPAQLGIAIAVGVFWWAHRWIGAGAVSFARSGIGHWLDGPAWPLG